MSLFRNVATVVVLGLRASRRLSAVVAALSVLSLFSALGLSLALKLLVDAAVGRSGEPAVLGTVIAILSLGAQCAAGAYSGFASLRLQEAIQARLDRLLMRFNGAPMQIEANDSRRFAEQIHLLRTEDCFPICGGLETIATLAGYAMVLVAACGIASQTQPFLALFPLTVIPVLWLIHVADRSWMRALESVASKQLLCGELLGLAISPWASKELRTFGRNHEMLRRYEDADADIRATMRRATWRSTLTKAIGWLLFSTAYALAVFITLRRATTGAISAGYLVFVITLVLPLVGFTSSAGAYLSVLGRLNAAGGRLRWLGDAARSGRNEIRDPPATMTEGIRLENVTFCFAGADTPTISDVSLTIPAGAVVALVGENGAGKSTLVNLVLGLYRPTDGKVIVGDVDLATVDKSKWWPCISPVFQDFVKPEFTAQVAVGCGDLSRVDDPDAIRAAVSRAGSASFLYSLPSGLATQLGRSWCDGVDLSTGQWQKVAVARGLMRAKSLAAVLDEPTAALDPLAEEILFERYKSAAELNRMSGAITLIVSHRLSTVRAADLIVVIEDGTVGEFGTHHELMREGGRYALLYAKQAAAYR